MRAVIVLAIFLLAVALLVRALRRRPSPAKLAPPAAPSRRAAASTPPLVSPADDSPRKIEVQVRLPGLEIVGESHYQDALEELAGGRTEDGVELEVEVSMVPESDNKYDPNAVGVEIDGELVGYLSRASAKKYRAAFGAAATEEWPARIVGGWDRGEGDRGSFGVRLEE